MCDVVPLIPDADLAESQTGGLPEDLELMSPGPALVTLLDSVDRAHLSAADRLRLTRARNRAVAWLQAQLYADIYATSLDETPDEEAGGFDSEAGRYPWTEIELAFALRWTRHAAGARLEQARQLAEDYPALWQALAAGRVDMPKVLMICELAGWLDDLPTARRLVEQALTYAEELTTGQLRARLRRWVLAIDPQLATRRAAAGVASRQVQTLVNEDGTGDVWGRSLPPQDCAAAWERLGAIARAAKAAGDSRTLAQLRADAFLDLLTGEGVATGAPVSVHTGGLAPHPDPFAPTASTSTLTPTPVPLPRSGSGSGMPAPPAPAQDPSWPAAPLTSADDEPEPSPRRDRVRADPAACQPSPDHPATAPPAAASTAETRFVAPPATAATAAPVAAPAPRKGVVELQVPLLTLLRLAEQPGELAGWGPVVADIARQIATQHTDFTWRFHVTNELGEVAFSGITRKRPTAAIAAHVRARDHTCVAPGCRHPARSCDLDHTVAKVDGGHSGPSNLGCLCRTHHRLKHAEGSHLVQVSPGTFGWTTPRGLQYTRRPHHPLADQLTG